MKVSMRIRDVLFGTLLLLILAAALGGCGATIPTTTTVEVPVPVSCIKESPPRPPFVSDAELAKMNDYQLPLALFRDREQRQGYEQKLEALMELCK